ncbi:MAG: class I SAM-dependent methyltransferase [Ignavibacteriae bacterium]|nr:MAG: class I SAM-dependent methyltransferase [Ignavibacteriota bacterium]
MYKELAKYYDIIYRWKDYAMEAEKVYQIIHDYRKSDGNDLLDAACGTGEHAKYLQDYFKITGVDSSPYMLEIARKKVKKASFIKGDMRNFKLNKQFDAIVCLFSAIAHLKDYNKLEQAISNFSVHLKKGGVLIIEPFVLPKAFTVGEPHALYVDDPELKIARMNISRRRNGIASIHFHFLIANRKKIEYLNEKHELALYETGKFLSIMKKYNLQSKFTQNGLMKNRGLYIGIKK